MSHWHHEVADPLAQQDLLMVKLMMRMTRLVMRMMARLVMTTVIEMIAGC